MNRKTAKKILPKLLLLLTVAALMTPIFCSCVQSDVTVLNVYNWGEYISDGSEDSYDTNAAFEEWYLAEYGKEVKVNYTTYASNEDMYAKLKSGAVKYDIVIPSDYMIELMIEEDMLEEIDFSNIPNYQYIDEKYRNLFYDPDNKYSVPYTYGMVGIIYNTKMVEGTPDSWSLMWDENYKGKILNFNNPRDAFGTAMYKLGIDVNTSDTADWDAAFEALKAQKPLVQSYVMDEIFNKMKGASAAIAPYYAGDFLTMYDDNNDLAFYYPKEGTNVFIDAICIPNGTQHKDIAEAYINFMLSEDAAIANAEYIGYASPNTLVRDSAEYAEYMNEIHPDAYDILYPENVEFLTSYFKNQSSETRSYMNNLWEDLKIESSFGGWIYIACAVIVVLLAAWAIFSSIRKKNRAKKYE
ncbi:MAG TPA: spermidine/putrescine ABC transporter substrate-binding protein [Clostridiales bacterium]|nr:spermidine/putrescine ABC transporter substrate-binding protein [Clostridiales bacterium]